MRGAALRLARWVRRKEIRLPTPTAAPVVPEDRGDARTRFWAEFRAGQREAAIRSAQRGPR